MGPRGAVPNMVTRAPWLCYLQCAQPHSGVNTVVAISIANRIESILCGAALWRVNVAHALPATRTEQEAEECSSPTKTPGSESRCMDGSVSEYYTITALDITPDDSKSNSLARCQHVIGSFRYSENRTLRIFFFFFGCFCRSSAFVTQCLEYL